MGRSFISNFLFLLLVNVLVKPIYVFGIDMKVQNVVGEEDFGLYFVIYNYTYLFFIVLDLGLTTYNSRIIAQDPGKLSRALPHFLLAKGILAIIYFACIMAGAVLLGYTGRAGHWVALLGVVHLLTSLMGYLRSNIAALHLFRWDALLSVANRLPLIGVLGLMLYGTFVTQFQVEHFILAQLGCLCVAVLLGLWANLHHTQWGKWDWDLSLLKGIFRSSWPYALLILLTTLYTRIDAVMLEQLLPEKGKTEAAYYAAAFRFWDMSAIFGLLMANQLLPMFARMIAQGDKKGLRGLVDTATRIILWVFITIAMLCWAYGKPIMALMFPDYPNDYVGSMLGLLMFSTIPVGLSYVFNTLMNANASLRTLNLIGVVGVVANICINAWLIPLHGAMGALYATLSTQGVAALCHVYFANQTLGLGLGVGLFLRASLLGLLMYGLLAWGLPLCPWVWWMQAALAAILAVPMAIGIGLWDKSLLRQARLFRQR